MKKVLLFILMFAAFASNAQTVGQFRYDTTIFRKIGGRNHVKIDSLIQVADSTGYKPLVVGADGVIKRNTFWPTGAGGGSGSIEYVLQGYGILIDSTGRLYTIKADSTVMGSKAYINAKDALYLPITDTASMLSPYLRSATAAATYEPIITVLPVAKGGTGTATPSITAGTNITSVTGTWPNVTINAATQGGGSSGVSVTEQTIHYRGEYEDSSQINTTTGAITATDASKAMSGYLHVSGSTSYTISVPNGYGNISVYGWSYDTTLTAISEIRSVGSIGTTLKTYTFTTPSNARFINVYVKYAGVDFAKALSIKSTNTITYTAPITPEQFSGTKSAKIQAAIDFARFTTNPVVLTGEYLIDSTLFLSSGSWLHSDAGATLTLDSGSHTNIIRNEAVANPNAIFKRGNTDIKITGNITFQGSKENWGGYPATGVGTQYWRAIAVYLAACRNTDIRGVSFKNTNMWALNLEQCDLFTLRDINIRQDSSHANQDGINLRRGTRNGSIENVKGVTWDDIVAFTNLKIGGDSLHILGITENYMPYATNFDIQSVTVSNVHRDTSGVFPTVFPAPFYKSGILLLCEDALKVHDITIDGVTGPQQVQVGYTFQSYWIGAQATVNDMYNINISNTNTAKINFQRPIKNSSFTNIARLDAALIANAVFASGTLNVYRKYTDGYPEYYETFNLNDGVLTKTSADFNNMGSYYNNTKTGGMVYYGGKNGSGKEFIMRMYSGVAASTAVGLDSSFSIQAPNNINFMAGAASPSSTDYFSWRLGYNKTSEKMYLTTNGLALLNSSRLAIGVLPSTTYDIETKGSGTTSFGLKIANSANDFMQVYQDGTTSYFRALSAAGVKDFKIGGKNILFGTGSASDPTTLTLDINGKLTFLATNTTTGTTGAQTINKASGKVNFAAAATTLVVTNSLVTTASIVMVTVEGTDATATSARVTPAAGSFTITLNAAATAETKVAFWVIN